jgi:large subunit ribosomal protein L15
MRLNEIRDRPGARKAKHRVGRGVGSGSGETAGRGFKGQKARAGVSLGGFEGGQMPLYQRLPKRGFNNPTRQEFHVINVGRIQRAIDEGRLDVKTPITAEVLVAAGLVRDLRRPLRLLGNGVITAKVTVQVDGASASAVQHVEKAGGSVSVQA